jgi:predicted dehydrogenase
MTVRVGIVGAGKMGISHYAIVNAHPQATVAAVCDASGYVLSVLAKYTGVSTFGSFEKLIDQGKVDAILVATPTSTHFRCAKYALERNLHLFVEKPLTLSPSDTRTLSELARQRKRVNQVGFQNRFIGTFQEARRIALSGALGQVTHIHGSAFGQVVTKEQSATWRSKKSEGGGCLHDYACHVVDLMNFIAGPPQSVPGARMQTIFSKDVEDAVYAIFSYADGRTGLLETNWSDETYRKMSTTITLYGTQGKLIADRQELKLYLRPGCTFEGYVEGWNTRYITELQKPVGFYLRGEEYSAQIDSFIAAIESGNMAHENSFASALETDRVLEQIAQASKVGS